MLAINEPINEQLKFSGKNITNVKELVSTYGNAVEFYSVRH